MSTTPRTDAKRIEGHPSLKEEEVAWAFARQLETELTAALLRIKELEDENDNLRMDLREANE